MKIMKLTAVLCAVFVMGAASVFAVGAEENDSSLKLPSGITIESMENRLNNISEPYASAAVGVFRGSDVLYEGYFGSIDEGAAADENSVYEWGSISKTLIWVSAMQLYEQGKLDLERDVREYLPEGFFRRLSYDEPITMLNLMNHNAGWQETTRQIFESDESKILPLKDSLQLMEPEQIHRPGEVAAYSNYGAAVAGYVIECVSGQDYCDYVHEHIFEPLGMERTALNPTHSDNEWVCEQRKKTHSYSISNGSKIDLGSCLNYIPAYPAGAAAGTLTDLMTYAQALTDDKAPLFADPVTRELMFTGTDFYGESDIPVCTHGFWCEEHGVRTYGHNGGTTSGQSNMIFDLESQTGLVVMVNEPGGNVILSDTPELVFGKMSADKYVLGEVKNVRLSSYYLIARSTYRGMLKFIPYLSAVPSGIMGKAEDIGRGVYRMSSESDAQLVGAKTGPDGSILLQVTSMDLLPDRMYIVKLCLFTAYVMMAVVSVFMLLIRRKLKKHGRLAGAAILTPGDAIARLASVLGMICTYVVYAQYSGGIPYGAGAVLGVLQMICTAVCGVSAVMAIACVIKEKSFKGAAGIICNLLTISAVVYFEMYRFW